MSQENTVKSQTGNGSKTKRWQRLLIGMGVSAVSGVLIAASMPDFDASFLDWGTGSAGLWSSGWRR